MSSHFIESLPKEGKYWSALAIAGIISSDGIVTPSEVQLLRETISFLDEIDQINDIVEMVKHKEKPKLGNLKTDQKTASKILLSLAMLAITDDSLCKAEVDYFLHIGKRLGFEEKFSKKVMEWGKEYIYVNKKRKELMEEAQQKVLYYENKL